MASRRASPGPRRAPGTRAAGATRGTLAVLAGIAASALLASPARDGRSTIAAEAAARAALSSSRAASAPVGWGAPGASAARTALFPRYGGPLTLGAPPRGLASLDPAECATCHAEIAAEWQGSAHARAFVDGVFLAEYLPAQERFCRQCHAPLVQDPSAPEAAALLARGVDCAACHVRDGHVLGARGTGDADHAARRDARLRTSAFCGPCHQFDFPAPADGVPRRYRPGRPLQDTLAEWRQSAYRDVPCQDCHMPQVASAAPAPPRADDPRAAAPTRHRSHAFSTLDSPALLARAVKVRATARRGGQSLDVTLELAPGALGHAFPTGDMFRQVEVSVRVGPEVRTALLERIFAQTIDPDARGHALEQVDDTRVLPGQRWRHRFRFSSAEPGATVRWSLTLFRLDPGVARRRGLPDALVRIPVAAGALLAPAR